MSVSEGPLAGEVRGARGSKNRQRQRLIDACISALHIHGPSRTTVEKVVAIANLSPGIVRFYFRSKAAMMVASLQYLATEFDEKVSAPVLAMRDTPVEAMRRLVDLYLDPELASPRKISVWYAFWGEATARQEYYEICGQKDDSFVALVRELMGRLVVQCGESHLDVDALSIGFIGLLEVLWQGFAFQSEADIDRVAARGRCIAYLRSIFPREFGAAAAAGIDVPAPSAGQAGFQRECDGLILGSPQPIAHERDLPARGDVLALELAGRPVLVVRGADADVHLFTNRCTHSPHELVPKGSHRGVAGFSCPAHGLAWDLEGRPATGADALHQIPARVVCGLVVMLPEADAPGTAYALLDLVSTHGYLAPVGAMTERPVAAGWQTVVEHWLDVWLSERAGPRLGSVLGGARVYVDARGGRSDWLVGVGSATRPWSLARFAMLATQIGELEWSRHFVAPNTLIERHAGGMSIMTVAPCTPDTSLIVRRTFGTRAADRRARALCYLAERLARPWLSQDCGIVESLQRALNAGRTVLAESGAASPLGSFRAYVLHNVPPQGRQAQR